MVWRFFEAVGNILERLGKFLSIQESFGSFGGDSERCRVLDRLGDVWSDWESFGAFGAFRTFGCFGAFGRVSKCLGKLGRNKILVFPT